MYEYKVYVQVLCLILWFHNFFHKKHLRKALNEKYLDLKLSVHVGCRREQMAVLFLGHYDPTFPKYRLRPAASFRGICNRFQSNVG